MTDVAPRRVSEFAHPALFYRDAEDFLAGTVPFVLDGLAAGDPVAAAVPGPNLRLLEQALGADAERVELVDMTVAGRNPARIIPGVLRAFADAFPARRPRIIGEPIWPGRSRWEYPACAQHEALINLAFADRPAAILCPYDVANLAEHVLADAEANHPVLIDADGTRASIGYAPERVLAQYNRPLPPHPAWAFRLRFDAGTLNEARRFATDRAIHFGLDDRGIQDFLLIVAELTANSVSYGGGHGTVSVWIEHGQLICEVRDSGHITDPLAGRRPVADRQVGGCGLLLVNHLSSLVRLHTGPDGTSIRVYLPLP